MGQNDLRLVDGVSRRLKVCDVHIGFFLVLVNRKEEVLARDDFFVRLSSKLLLVNLVPKIDLLHLLGNDSIDLLLNFLKMTIVSIVYFNRLEGIFFGTVLNQSGLVVSFSGSQLVLLGRFNGGPFDERHDSEVFLVG
jgi:hypothetical protein